MPSDLAAELLAVAYSKFTWPIFLSHQIISRPSNCSTEIHRPSDYPASTPKGICKLQIWLTYKSAVVKQKMTASLAAKGIDAHTIMPKKEIAHGSLIRLHNISAAFRWKNRGAYVTNRPQAENVCVKRWYQWRIGSVVAQLCIAQKWFYSITFSMSFRCISALPWRQCLNWMSLLFGNGWGIRFLGFTCMKKKICAFNEMVI